MMEDTKKQEKGFTHNLTPHLTHNLPLQLTGFVGREHQKSEVTNLLALSRLLTLTGAGGSGKTRLAVEIAQMLTGEFRDGVFFINLAPITELELVERTIARALDVWEAQSQSLLERLKEYLREKHMLLVLDNFEQVLEAAPLVMDLLLAAPGLKVLATSREPLYIPGEQLYHVPPLELPSPNGLATLGTQELSRYEAIALFVQRAQAADPHFTLTDENAPVIAQICARLDGLPLALELAAARMGHLPPKTLLERLDNRLSLLTHGPRNLPARQQTLKNTMEWSYDLLPEEEKQLFRRLSIFMGGRTLAATEEVCNYDETLRLDVLDGMQSLVSKSLLRPGKGSDGAQRFWILETVHEYAREKLRESTEQEHLQRAHALYFMRLAEEAEHHLMGARQEEWLNRLEEEHDNIRASLRWAREHLSPEAIETGLRTAAAIWRFWEVRGHNREGWEQLNSLLALSRSLPRSTPSLNEATDKYIAKALNGAGWLAYTLGNYSEAGSLFEEALVTARDVSDSQSSALALNNQGYLAYITDDYPTARALLEEALLIARQEHEPPSGLGAPQEASTQNVVLALSNLGAVTYIEGDYSAARALHEQSLALRRELEDKRGIAQSLNSLGLVAVAEGDCSAARVLHEQSLALRRELEDKRGIAICLANLANVACMENNYAPARKLFEESLVLMRELGDRWGIAYAITSLSHINCIEKNYAPALDMYRQSLTLMRELRDKWGIAMVLGGMGAVAAGLGDGQKGATLLGAAEALLKSIGAVTASLARIVFEEGKATARAQIGEEEYEIARQEGLTMSMESVIEYALEEPLEEATQPVSPSTTTRQRRPRSTPPPGGLTRREMEVLRLLSEGLSDIEIASRLFISSRTVHAHLHSVYNKLDVSTRAAAIRVAFDRGLL